MGQKTKVYDKAILEYMFITGTFYPYEHLSGYEKTIYLIKKWQLERPILKGKFNGKEIVDIVVPETRKQVLNPYNKLPLTVKSNKDYKKNSDVYFVFTVCDVSSKDGLSSDMPRKLVDVIYSSFDIQECRTFLKQHPIRVTEETQESFLKRKYHLCEAIIQFNNDFILEELNKQSKKILTIEKGYITEKDKKYLSNLENSKNIVEINDIARLSVAEKSLIKIMCYLNGDVRYEIYKQLSDHLRKLFLQSYWNIKNLVVPCRITESMDLCTAFPINTNRNSHPFAVSEYENLNKITSKQACISADFGILDSVEKNNDNQYNSVVALKDIFTRDCFLEARYINDSVENCLKSDAFIEIEDAYKDNNQFNVEHELAIIAILINCYKIESRRHIKKELYYLLKRMEKRFSENAYPLDVLVLLKNASHKREKRIITGKDFLVRSNLYKCINGFHNLVDIIAEVDVVMPDGIIIKATIPASYCSTCNLYYILEADYQHLKQKGIILCKIVKREFFIKKDTQENSVYDNMNEESILHSLGYNVNAQENLTIHQRRTILKYAVCQNILTKVEICHHLDWLIRRSKSNIYMQNAVQKWTEDREYIAQFQNDEMNVNSIISLEVNEYKRR